MTKYPRISWLRVRRQGRRRGERKSVCERPAPPATIPKTPRVRSGEKDGGASLVRKSLTNEQWDRIKGEFPGKLRAPGFNVRDNRLFVQAVLSIARTSSPWGELPRRFGKWYTAYTRYRRWSKTGVWKSMFEAPCAPACRRTGQAGLAGRAWRTAARRCPSAGTCAPRCATAPCAARSPGSRILADIASVG